MEETTGTLPVAHDLRINTDVGSIDVRGKARGVMYVIRKRAAVRHGKRAPVSEDEGLRAEDRGPGGGRWAIVAG